VTATVENELEALPLLVIVIVSVPASVVIVIPVPATSVSVSVAESATTLDCPATAIVAKLSDAAPPPDTVAHVLSPLRYVVASLVPDAPNLKTGTVPLVSSVAFNAVRFTPLAAGNVAGSAVRFTPLTAGSVAGNLAFGIVPEVNSVAFKAVSAAPPPLKFVAVSSPASDIVAELFCIIVPVVPS
jgi:hypothetical protein